MKSSADKLEAAAQCESFACAGRLSTISPPKVSVIVPVYNDRLHLESCLDALNQTTFPDFEIIVVDDGSTDDSATLARKMGARVLQMQRQGGPALARNRGVDAATGQYILFIDADVCVRPETVFQIVNTLNSEPDAVAVLGSYDTKPTRSNLVSQYKNLLHHFVHQNGKREASTFWTGCGMIRRDVFLDLGGFNAAYGRSCIEDIELGVRLTEAGHKIILDRDIQVTHCKHWSLMGLVRTDIFDRAIPWSQLILQSGGMPNDLNLETSQRISALFSCSLLILVLAGSWIEPWLLLFPCGLLLTIWCLDFWTTKRAGETAILATDICVGLAAIIGLTFRFGWWMILPCVLLSGIILLNAKLFSFFARARAPTFAAAVLPLHILYFVYSTMAFGGCVVWHHVVKATHRKRSDQTTN